MNCNARSIFLQIDFIVPRFIIWKGWLGVFWLEYFFMKFVFILVFISEKICMQTKETENQSKKVYSASNEIF